MKLINIPAIIAFGLSAFVQYNDPDPLMWIILYVLACIACLLSLFGINLWILPVAIGIWGFLWAGSLMPALQVAEDPVIWGQVFGNVEMKTMAVEITREIGGLWIVVIWMAFVAGMSFQKKPSS